MVWKFSIRELRSKWFQVCSDYRCLAEGNAIFFGGITSYLRLQKIPQVKFQVKGFYPKKTIKIDQDKSHHKWKLAEMRDSRCIMTNTSTVGFRHKIQNNYV